MSLTMTSPHIALKRKKEKKTHQSTLKRAKTKLVVFHIIIANTIKTLNQMQDIFKGKKGDL